VKERPILFTPGNIRAILEDRKTQTRRVIKPQPIGAGEEWQKCAVRNLVSCPYGIPGDRLWVRETFALENNEEYDGELEFAAPKDGRPIRHHVAINEYDSSYDVFPRYRATEPNIDLTCEHEKCNEDCGPCQHPWKPAIHMPRWASRITLEITEVRVQRVQEISLEDALAEGIDPVVELLGGFKASDPVGAYKALWDSINGKTHPWSANPWVWAITFRRLP
jgi:hypothetical protein